MKWSELTDRQKEAVILYAKRETACHGRTCSECSLHYLDEECEECCMSSRKRPAIIRCSLTNVMRHGAVSLTLVQEKCMQLLAEGVANIIEE